MENFIELSELQGLIKRRIGRLESWVRVEVESHREVRGHHYLKVLEKLPSGEITARADARIWSSRAYILEEFKRLTGKGLDAGMSVVLLVSVDYHPQFGLSLIVSDIDPSYTIGQREIELKRTLETLTRTGLMDRQKGLQLPLLPSRIAVISSKDAAGFGDFMKHLDRNDRGFAFNVTLFQALMQGEYAPSSIEACINAAAGFDVILILRGGGADSDLFCYDSLDLCRAIALCGTPVLTAIGHERDYHVADMVAHDHFKTPTALADFIVGWVSGVEDSMEDLADGIARAAADRITVEDNRITGLLSEIRYFLSGRVAAEDRKVGAVLSDIRFLLSDRVVRMSDEVRRTLSNITFALTSTLNAMESKVSLLEAGIKAADPRGILSQGYVLAVSEEGRILKNVGDKSVGESFSLRFTDGSWKCEIKDIRK